MYTPALRGLFLKKDDQDDVAGAFGGNKRGELGREEERLDKGWGLGRIGGRVEGEDREKNGGADGGGGGGGLGGGEGMKAGKIQKS